MTLPVHRACSKGNKSLLKKIIKTESLHVFEAKDEKGRTPLMLSVQCNQPVCAGLLIKSGVHVDHSDKFGNTALHIAVNLGLRKLVKLLLQSKASCCQKNFLGITPLHYAAIQSNSRCLISMFRFLIPYEVDVQDGTKKTPLHWSAAYSKEENIKALLLNDSNIYIPDEAGKTPLHWAVLSKTSHSLECIKILLEKNVSLLNWQDYDGRSALHLAVSCGTLEAVRYLVSRKDCDIDILDNKFCTPLHWASKRGFYEVSDILLSKKASPTSFDNNGATPLHYSVFYDHSKTLEVFLSRKYVFDVEDDKGHKALMWAAAKKSMKCLKVMAEHGIDLKQSDKYGLTAFHYAAIFGNLDIIEFLKQEVQFPINVKDRYGMTPFLRACEYGKTSVVRGLLDAGADFNACDLHNCYALHWSAAGGYAYLIQFLVLNGANVDCQDDSGKTPLHYSIIKSSSLNCVSVLLESGADANLTDIEGKTPLHWAIVKNNCSIIKLLCEYEADVNAMFLRQDWSTPLDVAVQMGYPKVIECLKQYGALRIKEIKVYAASKIQSWYRQCVSLKKSEEFQFSANTKCLTLNEDLKFLKQLQYTNNIYSPLKSVSIKDTKSPSRIPILASIQQDKESYVSESFLTKVIKQMKTKEPALFKDFKTSQILCDACAEPFEKYFRKINNVPTCKIENFEYSMEDCKIHTYQKAATTIQRSWRNYSMKRKFQKMKQHIQNAFKTDGKRLKAERKWNLQMQLFFEDYDETSSSET